MVSREVTEAPSFFEQENRRILQDPRSTLVVADARNFLLASKDRYDLIISEPSNPWISGISNLFTSEFFALAHQHLAPGGIMTQWFHTYSMSTDDLKTITRTYALHFPYVTVWTSGSGDLIMTGSDDPHLFDLRRYRELTGDAQISASLALSGNHTARDLIRHYLMSDEDLSSWFGDASINSDDLPRIEYNAPRSLYGQTLLDNLLNFGRHLQGRVIPAPVSKMAGFTGDSLDIPAMQLRVAMTGPPLNADVNWLLRHKVHETDEGSWFETISDRQISWEESDSDYRIQAIWLERIPEPVEPEVLMNSLLSKPGVANGVIQMPDGTTRTWVLGRDPKQARIEIAMVWTCPAGGESVDYFIARTRMTSHTISDWQANFQTFAQRIQCLPES